MTSDSSCYLWHLWLFLVSNPNSEQGQLHCKSLLAESSKASDLPYCVLQPRNLCNSDNFLFFHFLHNLCWPFVLFKLSRLILNWSNSFLKTLQCKHSCKCHLYQLYLTDSKTPIIMVIEYLVDLTLECQTCTSRRACPRDQSSTYIQKDQVKNEHRVLKYQCFFTRWSLNFILPPPTPSICGITSTGFSPALSMALTEFLISIHTCILSSFPMSSCAWLLRSNNKFLSFSHLLSHLLIRDYVVGKC